MKKLFMLAAMFCMLLSCTKEEISFDERIPINISVGQQTKANDSNFDNGDKVGIYVVNYTDGIAGVLANSGNQANNMGFEYTGSAWSPEEGIYWKDKKTSADFYAYYPYSTNVTDVTAHQFSVKADQSSEANFWASDFLWGKETNVAPTSSEVSIATNHKMSRMVIEIKPGSGFTDTEWANATKSVKIVGIKTASTIDLSTGVAIAQGEAGEIIPLPSGTSGTTMTYKAMMVPQTVADNSKLVVITVNGVDYVYRKGYTFNANTQHKFTITINKGGISVDITIGRWDEEIADNNGVAEEEEASIPNNQIWYVANEQLEISSSANFGSEMESHVYENGKGVITFKGNIHKIGEEAFANCESLLSINIPESVTLIENKAFEGCI